MIAIRTLAALVFSLLAARSGDAQETWPPDARLLSGLSARSIGPATMSGRVAAVDAVAGDPKVIWVGAATGGVWKSVDAGLSWKPVFDDQPVAAIGAVSICQSSPDIVWVGTGEGNPRNSSSVGNGVYRTLDGGKTWQHLGLEKTEKIHRIVLHPSDPDTAWVAALGPTWGEEKERGVFKTEDGGKSWSRVLSVNETTGCCDLVLDPKNPRKLIAALWDHRRWPWFFRSGGPGSGIHVTHDGGATWKKLTPEDGLPEGELGRIGLAIAPSDPRRVYAYVEAKENAILRSDDGGESWTVVGKDDNIGSRPFYFADLRVDPENPNRLYSLWSLISVSDDGGKSFRVLVPFSRAHPDHHAMWIDPGNGSRIISGNDGGVIISHDQGRSWRYVSNLPLAQFYHIRVDDDVPYNVYGGLQDNGSWRGPSQVWERGGIRNHHFREVDFGDGFDTVPDPADSMQGYAMSQEGHLSRYDLRTGETKDIRPSPPEGADLRFNWNAGIAIDPFDPGRIYYGSQLLHMSEDRGDTWSAISPDLTTDNPEWQKQRESGGLTLDVTGAENFTTIVAVAPSRLERGLLWVGTDDGRLHVTRDRGGSWASVENNVSGIPAGTWIPHVGPSPHQAGTAFVVFDDHRRSNGETYAYETTDYGATWRRLSNDGVSGYALVIAQDPVREDLLYLGTEFGLHVSLDRGKSFLKWTHGVPTCSVMDLVIQEREHDLVLGTHGRAAFILDDVRPLRELTPEVVTKRLHLFTPGSAIQHRVAAATSSRFPGDTEFRGENRAYGALLGFWLTGEDLPHPDDERERLRKETQRAEKASAGEEAKGEKEEGAEDEEGGKKKDEKVRITVRDREGVLVRTFEAKAHQGLNRVAWDLRRDAFDEPPQDEEEESFGDRGGILVLPGRYRVTVALGDAEASGEVTVVADPRSKATPADRRANQELLLEAGKLQEACALAVRRIHAVRADVDVAVARELARSEEALKRERSQGGAPPLEKAKGPLEEAARELRKSLLETEKLFWTPPETKGIPDLDDALGRVRYATSIASSSWDRPTAACRDYLLRARARVEEALTRLTELETGEVAAFRAKVAEAEIGLLGERAPIEIR